jgi:hypothetical protein
MKIKTQVRAGISVDRCLGVILPFGKGPGAKKA